jgi:hypothetical protein
MTFHGHSERGQASIELLGAMPAVLLAALVSWQLALAGHTLWLGAQAARVAARAEAVGRSPAAAARSALPSSLEDGLDVNRRHAGGVTVHVRVPVLLHRWHGPVSVAASSSFGGFR